MTVNKPCTATCPQGGSNYNIKKGRIFSGDSNDQFVRQREGLTLRLPFWAPALVRGTTIRKRDDSIVGLFVRVVKFRKGNDIS